MDSGLMHSVPNLHQPDQTALFDFGLSAQELFELLPIGVQVDDDQQRTLYVNPRFTEMLGYTLEDIADAEDWLRLAYPDPVERRAIRRDWSERLAQSGVDGRALPAFERKVTCKNGEKKIIEFYVRRVGPYYIYLNVDVTARAKFAEDMRRLAFTDTLTGKGNRRSFMAAGEALLAEGRRPLAGLMVDIDHFKALNDRFGHKIGDEALVEVAARCRAVLADDQHLARLGGEEFGVLLPGCDQPTALALAARLHHAVTERPLYFPSLDLQVPIGTCIGGAMATPEDRGIEGLMARADCALYEAKRTGRNRVCFSDG